MSRDEIAFEQKRLDSMLAELQNAVDYLPHVVYCENQRGVYKMVSNIKDILEDIENLYDKIEDAELEAVAREAELSYYA